MMIGKAMLSDSDSISLSFSCPSWLEKGIMNAIATQDSAGSKNCECNAIDFVLAWVDSSDAQWMNQYINYLGIDSYDEARYRDWGLLRYWFRCVEKFAPWIRKVFFVTWGHVPRWLNLDSPKIEVIKHQDFIPKQYLPTFSSHTIELNLHRINDLSNRFVYFNDDMFLTHSVSPKDFFIDNKPVDIAALSVHCYKLSQLTQMVAVRNSGVINEHYDFHSTIKSNWKKWLNPCYGKKIIRTLMLLGCPAFPGFYSPHSAQPLLKECMENVWKLEYDVLNETCLHRIRHLTDVNQWVFRDWQIAKGDFIPRQESFSHVYYLDSKHLSRQIKQISKAISTMKYKTICINDSEMNAKDFKICKETVRDAFQLICPNASSFEKYS